VLVLPDGTRLVLRPLEPRDRDGLVTLFARLSCESRRRRFLALKPSLTSRELDYFTQVDHVDHEAIAAIMERDCAMVGVARYVVYRDRPREAEVAIEIADDLQSLGLGTALARHVIRRARQNGVARLTATTLHENGPARRLSQRLAFRPRASHGRELHWELELKHGPASTCAMPRSSKALLSTAVAPGD
jgi:RimJ/RimL family protein N-acetyltransferase